jgi:hypothetical protein
MTIPLNTKYVSYRCHFLIVVPLYFEFTSKHSAERIWKMRERCNYTKTIFVCFFNRLYFRIIDIKKLDWGTLVGMILL